MHSVQTIFIAPEGGLKAEKRSTWESSVTELRFNHDYPKSIFWPVYDPGVVVWDKTKKKHYHTPEDKSDTDSANLSVGEVAPIRVTPPGDWMNTASTIGIGLGLAILATSLIMWLRRA